ITELRELYVGAAKQRRRLNRRARQPFAAWAYVGQLRHADSHLLVDDLLERPVDLSGARDGVGLVCVDGDALREPNEHRTDTLFLGLLTQHRVGDQTSAQAGPGERKRAAPVHLSWTRGRA